MNVHASLSLSGCLSLSVCVCLSLSVLLSVCLSLGFLLLAVTALDPNIILPTEDRKREPKQKKDKETNQATPNSCLALLRSSSGFQFLLASFFLL